MPDQQQRVTMVVCESPPPWDLDDTSRQVGQSKLRCFDREMLDDALATLQRDYHVTPLKSWRKQIEPGTDAPYLYVALFAAADLNAVREVWSHCE